MKKVNPLSPAAILFLVFVLSFPIFLRGQTPTATVARGQAETKSRPDASSVRGHERQAAKNLIRFSFWVEQADDGFWTDGGQDDFLAFVDNRQQALLSLQQPAGPCILLIVLDTIADLTRVQEARTVLIEKTDKLPENYWVGLLRAQNGLSVLQEPTADRKVVREKILAGLLGGKAGLLDVLEPVSTLAAEIQKKAKIRIVILYLSDGGIGDYRADYLNPVVNSSDAGDLSRRFSDRAVRERLTRQAETMNRFMTPIFVLHLNYYSDAMNLAYISGLEKIASDSGGAAVFCRSLEEIRSHVDRMYNRIRTGYQVELDEPAGWTQPASLRIALKDSAKTLSGRVIHPEKITPTPKIKKNGKAE